MILDTEISQVGQLLIKMAVNGSSFEAKKCLFQFLYTKSNPKISERHVNKEIAKFWRKFTWAKIT